MAPRFKMGSTGYIVNDKIGFMNGRLRLGPTTVSDIRIKSGLAHVVLDQNTTRYTRINLTPSIDSELLTNNHYIMPETDNATLILPSGNQGDFISVVLTGNIKDNNILKFKTPTNTYFSAGSMLITNSGSTSNRIPKVVFADGITHNFLNIEGLNNSDGGIGTRFRFICHGADKWFVEAYIESQGNHGSASSEKTTFSEN